MHTTELRFNEKANIYKSKLQALYDYNQTTMRTVKIEAEIVNAKHKFIYLKIFTRKTNKLI